MPPVTPRPSLILTIVRALYMRNVLDHCIIDGSFDKLFGCTCYFFSMTGAGVLEAWLHKLMSQVDTTLSGYKILQPGANGVRFLKIL